MKTLRQAWQRLARSLPLRRSHDLPWEGHAMVRAHGRLAVSYISRLEWGDNRYLDVSVFPGHPVDLA